MTNVLQFKKKAERLTEMTRAEAKVYAILTSSLTNVATLSEMYSVSPQTVRNIKLLKTKRAEKIHDMILASGEQPKTWVPAARFTEEQVAEIRASTETSAKLAKKFECSPSTIRMIKTRKTYV